MWCLGDSQESHEISAPKGFLGDCKYYPESGPPKNALGILIQIWIEIGKIFIYPIALSRYIFQNFGKKPHPYIQIEIQPNKLTLRWFQIKTTKGETRTC